MKEILHTSLKFNLVQIEDEIDNKNHAFGNSDHANFEKQKEQIEMAWDEECTMKYNVETEKDL